MKRFLVAILFVLPMLMLADDYLDDVYYSPQAVLSQADEPEKVYEPYYNKKAMKEIIFLDDTTSAQPRDTVRAIIRR